MTRLSTFFWLGPRVVSCDPAHAEPRHLYRPMVPPALPEAASAWPASTPAASTRAASPQLVVTVTVTVTAALFATASPVQLQPRPCLRLRAQEGACFPAPPQAPPPRSSSLSKSRRANWNHLCGFLADPWTCGDPGALGSKRSVLRRKAQHRPKSRPARRQEARYSFRPASAFGSRSGPLLGLPPGWGSRWSPPPPGSRGACCSCLGCSCFYCCCARPRRRRAQSSRARRAAAETQVSPGAVRTSSPAAPAAPSSGPRPGLLSGSVPSAGSWSPPGKEKRRLGPPRTTPRRARGALGRERGRGGEFAVGPSRCLSSGSRRPSPGLWAGHGDPAGPGPHTSP